MGTQEYRLRRVLIGSRAVPGDVRIVEHFAFLF
jgi:hypothetical protein